MKTRTIFKAMNKLVYDTIWYGFFVFFIVVLVAKPPMFFDTYYYTGGYSNPHITQQNQFQAPEGSVEITKDSDIVLFYEKIQPRVEFLRVLMIFLFCCMIFWKYKKHILNSLEKEQRQYWLNYQNKYNKITDKIKQKINW